MSDDVANVKYRLNIVDIVSEYLPLRKAGVNHSGLCPFHNEKTPSFTVSEDKQIWHCFGCGEGGDVFEFVMKIEGLEFYDTLKLLAQKAGVVLTESKGKQQSSSKRTQLLDILEHSANFYHELLLKHPKAQLARDYLQKRGLSDETINRFKIGYSPDAWHVTKDFLKQKGFSDQDILAAGITAQKDQGRFYDRFRDRVMFPISNSHGNVIAFSARVLDETKDKMGKYINSPQTDIYNKSQVLYGLDLAKSAIKQDNVVVIVEGQMDVIASHQAGISNVVASSGTALTIEQIKLIKRYTNNIAVCFDSDAAGMKAAQRGVALALEQGLAVKYVSLPVGKDPDDCIKQDPVLWQQAITKALPVLEYYINDFIKTDWQGDIHNRSLAVDELLRLIGRVQSRVEQVHYRRLLARAADVSDNILLEQQRRLGSAERVPAIRATTTTSKKIKETLSDRWLSLVIGRWPELNPELLQFNFDTVRIDVVNLEIFKKLVSINDQNLPKLTILTQAETWFNLEEKQKLVTLSLVYDQYYYDFNLEEARKEIITLYERILVKTYKWQLKQLEHDLKQAEQQHDNDAINEILAETGEIYKILQQLEADNLS